MDWKTFIAEIIKATSWPVAVVIVAIIFRRDIQQLLARVTKGKFGFGELHFQHILDRTEQASRSTSSRLAKPTSESPDVAQVGEGYDRHPYSNVMLRRQNLRSIAELGGSNRDKVISAWVTLEFTIGYVAARVDMPGHFENAYSVLLWLVDQKELSSRHLKLYDGVRELKNTVTHSPYVPTDEELIRYMALVHELIFDLNHIADKASS